MLVKIISRAPAAAPAAVTSTAAKPPPALAVKTYRIEGNTVLPPQDFGVLSDYTGTNVAFPRLREGLVKVQLRYHELGYPTISVTLPPQKLTNGLVSVKVVEGRLGKIRMTGNTHFSHENIRRALPSLTTNILLNTKWFQPELDQANAEPRPADLSRHRARPEPGTSELTLKVKDRLPLHGRFEINDKSSPGTPLLRSTPPSNMATSGSANIKSASTTIFRRRSTSSDDAMVLRFLELPLIASLQRVLPAAARRRRRPARGLRPEAGHVWLRRSQPQVQSAAAVRPSRPDPLRLTFLLGHEPVQYGPVKTIFTNTLANIGSRMVHASPTINDNIGAKLTLPLPAICRHHSALSFGADWKSYSANTSPPT